MADQTLDVSVELGNDQVAGLGITMHNQLANQELGVAALRQLVVAALQFLRNQLALFQVTVLQSRLNDSHGVVLEDEIADTAGDNLKKLLDELLALFQRDVGLASELLPELLGAGDGVGVGLGGLALLLEDLLLCVRLAGVVVIAYSNRVC